MILQVGEEIELQRATVFTVFSSTFVHSLCIPYFPSGPSNNNTPRGCGTGLSRRLLSSSAVPLADPSPAPRGARGHWAHCAGGWACSATPGPCVPGCPAAPSQCPAPMTFLAGARALLLPRVLLRQVWTAGQGCAVGAGSGQTPGCVHLRVSLQQPSGPRRAGGRGDTVGQLWHWSESTELCLSVRLSPLAAQGAHGCLAGDMLYPDTTVGLYLQPQVPTGLGELAPMSFFPVSTRGSVSARAYSSLDYIKTQNPPKE